MNSHEKSIITKYDLLFESRLTRAETMIEKLDESIDNINKNMSEIKSEIKSDFRWLFGLIIVFSGSIVGIMAKGFHWY